MFDAKTYAGSFSNDYKKKCTTIPIQQNNKPEDINYENKRYSKNINSIFMVLHKYEKNLTNIYETKQFNRVSPV